MVVVSVKGCTFTERCAAEVKRELVFGFWRRMVNESKVEVADKYDKEATDEVGSTGSKVWDSVWEGPDSIALNQDGNPRPRTNNGSD